MSERTRTLRLENDLVSRVFAATDGGSAGTTSLRNCRTGKEFIVPESKGATASREFSVRWRGRRLCGRRSDGGPADFVFLRSSRVSESDAHQTLDLYLTTPDNDLEIRLTHQIYAGHPLVRKWLTATNRGKTPGRLEGVVWEDLALSPGPVAQIQIAAGVDGRPLTCSWAGSDGAAIAVVLDPPSQQGCVVINEAPGPAGALEINKASEPRLRALLSPAFGGRTLQPGEAFVTPAVALLLFDDRSPPDAAQARAHEYFRQIVGLKGAGAPPAVYTATAPPEADSAWAESQARPASAAGLGVLCVEGEALRADRLQDEDGAAPAPLGQAARLLDSLHLGLGIGLPLASVDPGGDIARQRPEWLCRDAGGNPVSVGGPGGRKRLMVCLATDYREHLRRVIARLCRSAPITFLHLTGPATGILRDSLAPCNDSSHKGHGAEDSVLAVGQSLRALCEDLRAEFPGLVLGFDHDLWGRSNGIDAASLHAAHFVRICAFPDARGQRAPLEARRIFYQRARLFPPECLAVGLLAVDGPNPVAALSTAVAGLPILAGRIERLTPGQIDWLRSVLAWRESLFRRVNFHERFYVLHGSADVSAGQWDGYAKLSREGEGFLAVFRNGSPLESQTFSIPGVDPMARYRLDSIFRDRPLGAFSAAELRDGVSFKAPHEDGADLIEIRRE